MRKTIEVDSIGPSILNIAPTDGSTLTVDNGSVFNNGLNVTITGSTVNAENGRTVSATVDLGLSTESSANTQITNGAFTFTNFNIKPGFH